MKILIAADMEGVTGVVHWDQVMPGNPNYPRFRKLMTDDVNAAIRGAFAGGATVATVTDGHNDGRNIMIEEIDPRASLTSGWPVPLMMVNGVNEGVDGVLFIGYHGRMGAINAILDHTYSDERISGLWINDRSFGEAGMNGALCGHFGVPVIMASGDQTLCAEAREFFGDRIETAQVKKAVSRMAAECLPPEQTGRLIEETAQRAVTKLKKRKAPKPFVVSKPIKMTLEFEQSEMADKASYLPHAQRTKDRCVEYIAGDMVTISKALRAMLALAR